MLNLLKPISETLVVVAMSGGVDSSVVAAMLVEAGYKVVGITLQLYDQAAIPKKIGSCCAGQDIYDAKKVADKLGIPHYVFDYENNFKASVINDFVDSYARGFTPLPCAKCNQSVKFRDLLNAAKELGADALATGHYVRKIHAHNKFELHKGLDHKKDQSYFLFATTYNQLEFLQFPLGNLSKDQTREMAKKYGLMNAEKPDSQDICFVPDGNYADLIKKLRPSLSDEGKIVHIEGYELGTHQGIIHFTIGQRKGLKISASEPLYVIKIDPENKIVYVGPQSALNSCEFIIEEVNWLGRPEDLKSKEITVKLRSAHNGAQAQIIEANNSKMKIKLFEPARAITKGQACVIYDNSRMLGGGWIAELLN